MNSGLKNSSNPPTRAGGVGSSWFENASSLTEHQFIVRNCLARIDRWRTPRRWSPSDWLEEIQATAFAATWDAICLYDKSRGVTLNAYMRLHIIKTCYGRYRKKWNYALNTCEEASVDDSFIGNPYRVLDETVWLEEAVGRLTEGDALLVRDLYWNGRSESEVARDLGVTQQAINKKKQRILETLRFRLLDIGQQT